MDHRTERISEALREELSELIGYEMADPRIAPAWVTAVHISPDKRRALVRIGVPDPGLSAPAVAALESGKGFLKSELARRLQLFRIPELHFEADPLAESGDRLDHLLKRIRKGRPRDRSAAALPAEAAPSPPSHPPQKKALE